MITILGYRNKQYRNDISIEEIPAYLSDKSATIWVDLEGPTVEETEMLEKVFHFHPLTIEDCQADNHFPKVDNYQDYLFMVMHGVHFHTPINQFSTVETNLYSGLNFLVTFHKAKVRAVAMLREKCEKSHECLSSGANILLYHLLDILVNNYLPILNEFDDYMEAIEDELFRERDNELLENLFLWRKTVLKLRRIIGPQRDVLNVLSRGDMTMIQPQNRIYFRDIYDHLYRIYEMSETYRDNIAGALELYLIFSTNEQSAMSHRMNEVIKILTIVSTVLTPPIVIASIYGMNFKHMPELDSPYGYFFALGLMLAMSLTMALFLKKKKWL